MSKNIIFGTKKWNLLENVIKNIPLVKRNKIKMTIFCLTLNSNKKLNHEYSVSLKPIKMFKRFDQM